MFQYNPFISPLLWVAFFSVMHRSIAIKILGIVTKFMIAKWNINTLKLRLK